MGSTFASLESARQGLSASQAALEVTSQNISNAATPGYTRQRLNLTSIAPDNGDSKFLSEIPRPGRGVRLNNIEQVRDNFLDNRYRNANSTSNNWSTQDNLMSQIEDIFNEFGTGKDTTLNGIGGQLADLVNELKTMQSTSGNPNLATTVKDSADLLCKKIRSDYKQLEDFDTQQRTDFNDLVMGGNGQGGLNATLKNISDLNTQIMAYEVTGQTANELRDQRNLLLDNLSADFDVDIKSQPNGTVTVALKGDSTHMLIDGNNNVTKLKLTNVASGQIDVKWDDPANSDPAATVTGGKVEAYLKIINGDGTKSGAYGDLGIVALKNKLNDFSVNFKTIFNNIATNSSFTNNPSGKALIQGTNAADIDLSADWKQTDTLISDNYKGSDLNGYITRFTNDLKSTPYTIGSSFKGTMVDFGDSFTMDIANQLKYQKSMDTSSSQITSDLDMQRQSVSSVSIDDEGMNIIKFTQSYNAAARVVTAIDQMLETLIKGTGEVGR